jgi:hypothetical protein
MDVQTLGLAGLIAYGLVNAISWWKPDLDKGIKLVILLIVTFGVLFVPPSLGSLVADRIKEALAITLLMTGVGKLANKVGGN